MFAFLEWAQGKPKVSATQKPVPPSFPMRLPPILAPVGLVECVWHMRREMPIPHQLVELEAKLLAAKSNICQQLTSHFLAVSVLAMMRTWMRTLAKDTHDFPLQ